MPTSKLPLFLDIDGVLLRRRPASAGLRDAYEVAEGALDLLEFAVERFACRWLSTRCRNGNADGALRAFRLAGASASVEPRWRVLDRVEPVCWTNEKTEAIDFMNPFVWLDDDPTDAEMAGLRENGAADQLILVRVDHDPADLLRVRRVLAERHA